MTWSDLIAVLGGGRTAATAEEPAAESVVITGIAYNSRAVAPGNIFVALRGQRADGAAFVGEALERGAAALVLEQPPSERVHAPWVVVEDARLALAQLSAAFFGHPSSAMQVVGITGTNGKTTTAYLVSSIFEAAGVPCGVLGTVAYHVGDEVRDATHTTPEAADLQRLLREMVDRGCGACAMEVSSHALALRRVEGTTFAAAVFTNLTRDHLDFHADMEAYFHAKRRLFEMLPPGRPSLVNIDDPRGPSLADMADRPVTFAIDRRADVMPGQLTFSLDGLCFDVRTPRGALRVRSRLVGRPNVYNILAAVSAGVALDLSFHAIERGIRALEGVPGRFQVVSGDTDGVTVVIDYAHTDDALRNLLETARPLAAGRLITVFGCGGDRDRTKRPLMGAVAARSSDVVLVTSDNPRSEDPARIIDEIRLGMTTEISARTGRHAGVEDAEWVVSIPDRQEAIERAIAMARAGDLVLIAGKGHEKYQVIGTRVLPFDDVAVARRALANRRTNSGVV